MVIGNVFKSSLADLTIPHALVKSGSPNEPLFKLDKETKILPNFIATIEAIQIFLYPISFHVKRLFILDISSFQIIILM